VRPNKITCLQVPAKIRIQARPADQPENESNSAYFSGQRQPWMPDMRTF